MQYVLNKDHQHHKWQLQKSWTRNQGFQDIQDKQQMQYLLILRSKWKMNRRCKNKSNVRMSRNFDTPTKTQMAQIKQQWTRNGKNSRKYRCGSWRKSEVRKRWSMKQVRRAQKFFLPHWWTSVIWKMPSWRQGTKNTRVELYSEAILWKMIRDRMQYSPNKDHQHHNSEHSWEKVPNWECLFVNREKGLFLSVYVDEKKMAGKRQNIYPIWKVHDIVDNYRNMFASKISAGGIEKLPCSEEYEANISSWSYDMDGHAKKCVERYCEVGNKTTQQLHKTATPCIDNHEFKEDELGSVGELSKVCSNCSELSVFGSNWQTWYLMVCKQACSCHHEVDESMRRTFCTFDLLHSSHKWTQTILSCGKHCTTM